MRVAFHPDGRRLAIVGSSPKVRILDIETGRELGALEGHTFWVARAVFSRDGRWLASGGESDNLIKIWDADNFREVRTLRGHLGGIRDLAFSLDDRSLASASADGTARVWDHANDQQAASLRGHQGRVDGLDFDPDGLLVSGSADHDLRIWDVGGGQSLRTLGRHIAVLEPPDQDGAPGRLLRMTTESGHRSMVRGVAFSGDGKLIASSSFDRTIRIWEAATGNEVAALPHEHGFRGVRFSPDGRALAAYCESGDIMVWDLPDRRVRFTLPGREARYNRLVFSPDGRQMATACSDGKVRLWDARTGGLTRVLPGHTGAVLCVAYNGDGRRLASGGEDRLIRVWDTSTWREPLICRGHSGGVGGLAFHPRGDRLASAGGAVTDAAVKIWDLVTGQDLLTLPGLEPPLAFSPDGARLACSGGRWQTIKVLDARAVAAVGPPHPDRSSSSQLLAVEGPGAAETLPGRTPPSRSTAPRARLKVLGSYSAAELPAMPDKGRSHTYKMNNKNKRFFVVVLSVPLHYLNPSEPEYRAMKGRATTARPGQPPLPQRTLVSRENAGLFRLILADGRDKLPGRLLTPWPIGANSLNGFTPDTWTISHYTDVGSDYRRCFAIAWDLDVVDLRGPFHIQVGDSAPVRVPGLDIEPPSLPARSVRELNAILLQAHELARRGEHAEAATLANSAARELSADDVTLYNAACVHSLASIAARKDERLPIVERGPLAGRYEARAVELLHQAIRRGFGNLEHARNDEDLAPLQRRADFQGVILDLAFPAHPFAR